MGWGMVPDQFLARRVGRLPLEEVLPGSAAEVALYWHHWEREPVMAQRLTLGVREAAGGLTFEFTGRRRKDARPARTMINMTAPRASRPAVGAPVERWVRPHRTRRGRLPRH